MKADCVVIGGGVMGCAVSLRLAQAGVDVVVLEKAIPGAEASSAAAGILAAQEESEGNRPLTELAVESRDLFDRLAPELEELTGIDIGFRKTPLLRACFSPEDEADCEARYAWQRERGWRLEWARGAEVRHREPALAESVISALVFPDDGQLEPRLYLKALSLAAGRAGARFKTGAYVRRILTEGGRVRGVEMEGERISAPTVVLAAGAWSSLVEGAGLPSGAVRPVRGQIVQLETRPPAIRGTVVTPRGGYVVGRADGRVLCGSTMEWVGYEKAVTAAGVKRCLDLALELAPGLGAAPVTDTWANFRPATEDGRPFLGPAATGGLVLATGHFRNGILLSPVTAEIVRDVVVHGESRRDLSPFTPGRDQDSA